MTIFCNSRKWVFHEIKGDGITSLHGFHDKCKNVKSSCCNVAILLTFQVIFQLQKGLTLRMPHLQEPTCTYYPLLLFVLLIRQVIFLYLHLRLMAFWCLYPKDDNAVTLQRLLGRGATINRYIDASWKASYRYAYRIAGLCIDLWPYFKWMPVKLLRQSPFHEFHENL